MKFYNSQSKEKLWEIDLLEDYPGFGLAYDSRPQLAKTNIAMMVDNVRNGDLTLKEVLINYITIVIRNKK